MKIEWLGHCCFRLTESTGTTIVTDPYAPREGYAPALRADVVTCSHAHPDHGFTDHIDGDPLVVTGPGFFEVKGVDVATFAAPHGDGTDHLVAKFRMDGVDLCHLGDVDTDCTPDFVETLGPVDVLFLPIGGNGASIDAETAKEYIELLMPEIVIPMFFREDDFDADLDPLRDFLRLFDDESIRVAPSAAIEFERDDFDGETTTIVVLTLPDRD